MSDHSEPEFEALVVEVGGLRFDAIAAGPADGAPVLLLHGFPAFADCWTGVMGALAGVGFQTMAVDQRGYSPGARPLEIIDYGGARLVDDTLAFMQHLRGDTPVHLVGHDLGGFVAWMVAAAHPQRLASLTVVSTPHPAAFAHARHNDPDQRTKSGYIDVFRRPDNFAEAGLLRDDAANLRKLYGGKVPIEVVARNVERLRAPGALTAALNWYRALDAQTVTGPVSVPTLYIWSTGDVALGATAAHATAQHVTGPYRFEILQDKSHWLPDEAAPEIAELIRQHLASVG